MINKDRLQMYVSLTKITIVLCWLSLFSFWAIKLFGGNWFEIMVENENFVKFSKTVETTWLRYVSIFITTAISNHLTFCAIAERFALKGKQLAFLITSDIAIWFVVSFVNIELLKMYFAYILIVSFSLIYQKGWKKIYGFMAIVFETIFTLISMLTRNIPIELVYSFFIGAILSIDFYLMYAIYYLYLNLNRLNKENNMAFIVGRGWLGKEDAQAKGYSAWNRFWHNFGYVVTFKWARKAK